MAQDQKKSKNPLQEQVDTIKQMGTEEEKNLGTGSYYLDFLKWLDEMFPGAFEEKQVEENKKEEDMSGNDMFEQFLSKASEQRKLLQSNEMTSNLAMPQIDLASLFTNNRRA